MTARDYRRALVAYFRAQTAYSKGKLTLPAFMLKAKQFQTARETFLARRS